MATLQSSVGIVLSLAMMLPLAHGGLLKQLCVGEAASSFPDLSLSNLGLVFQMDHANVSAVKNLTESALYPLHLVGDYEEAMIHVHAPNNAFLVNLEPGHSGEECRFLNKGNHDATIWLSSKPSASYVQLMSLGNVTVDVWATVNTTILGYDRYSFEVYPDEEELAIVAELRETEGSVVVDGVALPAEVAIPTPAPSKHLNHSVVLPAGSITAFAPSPSTPHNTTLTNTTIESVEETPSTSPSHSPSPTNTAVTFPPTRTSSPTVTSSPTHSETCILCGDPSAKVTDLDALVSIMGLKVSCGVLQSWADDKLLSPETCSAALTSVAKNCACQPGGVSPAPSIVLTFPPTTTMVPTTTPAPSYSTKCTFDVDSQCFDANASINMLGLKYPCKMIVADGNRGRLSPETCAVAQEAFARGDCACSPTRSPSSSPVPTVTPLPTYSESCVVCVGDDDLTVQVHDEQFSCGELRTYGASRLIDAAVCAEFQRIAELGCACPIPVEAAETSSPTSTPKAIAQNDQSPASSAPIAIGLSTAFMTASIVVMSFLLG
jgi:hypothetical protein